MYIHAYEYVDMENKVDTCIHIYTYLHVYMCIHTYTYVHIEKYKCIYIRSMKMLARTCTLTALMRLSNIHTQDIHIYIYIHS